MQLDFCPNCFANTQTNFCPKCGFDISSVEYLPDTLAPGTVLKGKYKIGRVLGIGGFGITYTGFDIEKNVRYAIKEYMPSEVAVRKSDKTIQVVDSGSVEIYNEGLDKFLKETNILITLNGTKTIVEAYDFFLENNTGYLVMEYLDGVSVKILLNNRGTLDSEFALDVLFEVARALRVVHAKGIYHRDISPENIMVLKDGSIKLIDFGAAKNFIGEKSKMLMLKHGFAPPEQYSASGNQGAWTDIYALAATYYKLVTGKTPADAPSRMTSDTVERLDKNYPGVKPHVGKAIHKALALNYRDRYQNVEQFIQALKIPEVETPKKQESNVNTPSTATTTGMKTNRFTSWLFGEKEVKTPPPPPPLPPKEPKKVAYIRVVRGAATVGLWNIPDNQEVSVGRDSGLCNIIVTGPSVSRKHCSIKYDAVTSKFVVQDLSSNGTYFSDGRRMERQLRYSMNAGSIIMLASPECIMEMGVR